MCGIAGIVSFDGFDPALLISMTNLSKYRGPDGYGFVYFDVSSNSSGECFYNRDGFLTRRKPSLGFGARRLAILDVSESGNQPMQIEDGQYWITYNGEIYNYLEIREELENDGHSFHTGTDTEVILKAYSAWGPSCVDRFNGMWSFAIWDRCQRKLFCSRDRFGIKPFYYFSTPSLLIFGSEIKQILLHPNVPRDVNEPVALQYLELGLQDHSDRTFFRDIHQLPAGHSLTVEIAGSTLKARVEKYWDLAVGPDRKVCEAEALEEFSSLLQRAVRWQLRSDVPLGSCLSGGLDSSSVVSLAARMTAEKGFHCFSSCFDDERIDERTFIREVVSSTNANSHLVFPRVEGFWDDLKCLIWHQDEPVGGTGVYAQWCVMRAARRAGIPVLLDGQGGDEILCGYRKFYVFHLWHLLKRAPLKAANEALHWFRGADRKNWNWAAAKRYVPFFNRGNRSLLNRVCNSELISGSGDTLDARIGPGQDLRQRQKDDLVRFSIPALLHYEDRNSMAHSVEARVPLLDHSLAEFAVNCPAELKLRDGWTKWILRQALRGVLPERVRLRRTKLGFATPEGDWLKQDLRRTIRDLIQAPELKIGGILRVEKVRNEFNWFLAGKPGGLTEREAFRILGLELWAQIFGVVS